MKNSLINKQGLIIFLALILCISPVLAMLDTPTAIDVSREKPLIFDGKQLDYNILWDKYKPIQVNTWLDIPMISKTTAEMYINKHTETCGQDCSSNIVIDLKERGSLVDDVRFYTLEGEDKYLQPIRSYQFYIKTSEKDVEVNDYEWTCTPTGKININGTEEQTCENKLIGTHIEKEPLWETYELGSEVDVGVYEVKLEGQKSPSRSVDWVIKTQGIYLEDWATWSGSTIKDNLGGYDDVGALVSDLGIWFIPNYNLYIVNITTVSAGFTTCYLRNMTGDALNTSTAVGTNVAFNSLTQLIAGQNYSISCVGTNLWRNQTGCGLNRVNRTAFNVSDGFYSGSATCGRANTYDYTSAISSVTTRTGDASVTLNSPANNYISPSNSVDFNCSATVTGGATLTNMSLWTNRTGTWTLNTTQTKTGTTNNSIFSNNYSNGNAFLWTCQACDSDGDCGFASENRTVSIDTQAPTITINSPTTTMNYGKLNGSETLNYSITDTNFASAWYNYNGTNVSLIGAINTTTFILDRATGNNLTLYSNDSVGNVASSSINWSYKVFENSRTYNSSTYETKSEIYSINVTSNSSLTAVNLIWNGTTYSTTKNGEIYSRTFDIPLGNLTKPFYWNFTYAGSQISSDSNNVTIGAVNFGLCNSSLTTKFLNLTFKDEANNLRINASIPTSTFTYYLGSGSVNKTYTLINNTVNYEYDFCALPNQTLLVLPYVQYSRDTYPQRIWQPTVQSYSNVATNQTLYLLGSTDGIYVTFQVLNPTDQPISGVTLTATRNIGGVDVIIGVVITSTSGLATLWVNPDFLTTFTFSKSGFTDYVYSDFPTQDSYTITFGSINEPSSDYTKGISTISLPKQGELFNDTTYSFEFNVTSSYWDLDSFGFNLRLANGTIVCSDSSSTSGSPASCNYNVNNQSIIYMDYYWIINGTELTGSKYWIVTNSELTGWSIKTFFTDLNSYLNVGIFGLDNFGKNLIIFLILFISVGVMSYKFGMSSPMSITALIFSIIFFFDIIIGLISPIRGIDHLLTYIAGVLLIGTIISEVAR